MNISNDKDFIEFIKKIGKSEEFSGNYDLQLSDATIQGLNASWFCAWRLKFINCNFMNCFFEDFQFNSVEFINCEFNQCYFQHVVFMDCSISNCKFEHPFSNTLLFGMTTFEEVKFNEVEFQFTTFSDCGLQDVLFEGGWIHIGKFETGDFTYSFKTRASFNNISFDCVLFRDLDLTQTIFKSSGTGLEIINCKLAKNTFTGEESEGVSSVDFFSLLQSEDLPITVLKSVFGITTTAIKEILSNAMSEPEFHTVFISYSFKNAEIAKELKRLLNKNGIKSFLWKNDAPAGKRLKKIMIDGIRDYDKFLFIASKNSLKSEACHFEITEARNKYYETWADVFVPIHIDDYLLTVRKEDIPSKFAEKYWENISELKEFNSLDFTFVNNATEIEGSEIFPKLLQTLILKK